MSVHATDFDALALGDSFITRGRTVTEAEVVSFAPPSGASFNRVWRTGAGAAVSSSPCLSGDMHPQHTDAAWAATSLFGERIAHGMLVASLALGLLDFDPERVIALRRVRDAVFKRPVSFGDTIHVAARVDG